MNAFHRSALVSFSVQPLSHASLTTETQRTKRLHREYSKLLSRFWLRLRFRNAIDHSAIGCHQILRRRCFDLGCRDVLEWRQQRIDLLWIVTEKCDRRKDVRLSLS